MNKTDNLKLRKIITQNEFTTTSCGLDSECCSGSGSGCCSGSGSGCCCRIPFGSGTACDKLLNQGELSFTWDFQLAEINCPRETELLYIKFTTIGGIYQREEITVTNHYKYYKTDYNGSLVIPIAWYEPKLWQIFRTNSQADIHLYAAAYACNFGFGYGSGNNPPIIFV